MLALADQRHHGQPWMPRIRTQFTASPSLTELSPQPGQPPLPSPPMCFTCVQVCLSEHSHMGARGWLRASSSAVLHPTNWGLRLPWEQSTFVIYTTPVFSLCSLLRLFRLFQLPHSSAIRTQNSKYQLRGLFLLEQQSVEPFSDQTHNVRNREVFCKPAFCAVSLTQINEYLFFSIIPLPQSPGTRITDISHRVG